MRWVFFNVCIYRETVANESGACRTKINLTNNLHYYTLKKYQNGQVRVENKCKLTRIVDN